MAAILKTEQFKPEQYRLEFMSGTHLDAVLAIEQTAYPFPWTRGNFADSIAAGYSAWALFEGKVMIGYAVTMIALDEAHLLNITVAPAYQSRGTGTWLLRQMIELARSRGARRLFLEVRPSNLAARRLYVRFGMVQMGVRRKYYPDHGGRREDALVLTLDFKIPA